MGAEPPTVRIKGTLTSPHPWIWRTRLERSSLPRRAEPGSVVRVVDGEGVAIGRGLLHPLVTIGIRLLTRDPDEAIDAAFFRRRFEAARVLRTDVLRLDECGNSYRLVHAESDGLSGLIVDVLGDVIRVDMFCRGMAALEEPIREALLQLYPDKTVVVRGDGRTGDLEGFSVRPRANDANQTEVVENGIRYKVDLREGHKTGFFLDQRENREFLGKIVRGREVFDLHTYTGGFALNAAVRGEAKRVIGVDLDEKAIAVAKRNAKLNQARNLKFVQADAFHYLRDLIRKDDKPGVIVLDPPKLARDAKEKEDGLRAYGDLNRLGLNALADDGILLTCSCSGVISDHDFIEMLRASAARTQKELTVFHVSGAAADHPVGLHVPETRYLKAVFARVRSL
jgi:23S rRNA (cytosine1962-C5)-methyltransferase